MTIDSNALIQEAILAREKAYVPYSGFKVGAALLDDQGQIHHGCNIENAAYGPSNCAERTALFSAVAHGHKPGSFTMLAVVGDTDGPIAPCGVCRQVLVELCKPDMPVWLSNLKGDTRQTTIKELLPDAFGPWDLEK
ncbi:cytidine deaminase [Saccharibacillus sp. JS10]|uniref:cytidine deaminase n=1 Tax=Saccharibacillus sp. JS10 TaxID=2950552 RepID=UPI00272E0E14|nr:cytidine deaminase [Saccharibacillus sp. JS10]